MGIPNFYSHWIQRHDRNGLNRVGILSRSVPREVSSFSIDMNGLIHSAAQKTYAYGEHADTRRVALLEKSDPGQLEYMFFNNVGNELLRILTETQPRDLLIMAVDGVAPRSKINQQRSRRFRSAKDSGKSSVFNSNSITPGTDMMMRLDNFIQQWILINQQQLPPQVIYSSHLVPGEGEHKIMDFMRAGHYPENKGSHLLYGLDADLVMLSLLVPVKGINLIRENLRDIVVIDNFRIMVEGMMGESPNTSTTTLMSNERRDERRDSFSSRYHTDRNDLDEGSGGFGSLNRDGSAQGRSNRVESLDRNTQDHLSGDTRIQDFVLLSFLLGNDFLPHPPSMEDLGYTFDRLIAIYKENRSGPLTRGLDIDWERLSSYIQLVSEQEPNFLEREAERSIGFPSQILLQSVTQTSRWGGRVGTSIEKNVHTTTKLDFESFRARWYTHALGPKRQQSTEIPTNDGSIVVTLDEKLGVESPFSVTVERIIDMTHQYLIGLAWVFRYYQQNWQGVNIDWYYPYQYTPLFVDLADYISGPVSIGEHLPTPDMEPFSPIHQLLAVLPRSSIELLPVEVQHLMDITSPIIDQYPEDFIIDTWGKNKEHQGIALLPFADLDRIVDAVNETSSFTQERADLFAVTIAVEAVRDPDDDDLSRSQDQVRSFISSNRGRGGFDRGRGRGGFDRGRGRGGFDRGGSNRSFDRSGGQDRYQDRSFDRSGGQDRYQDRSFDRGFDRSGGQDRGGSDRSFDRGRQDRYQDRSFDRSRGGSDRSFDRGRQDRSSDRSRGQNRYQDRSFDRGGQDRSFRRQDSDRRSSDRSDRYQDRGNRGSSSRDQSRERPNTDEVPNVVEKSGNQGVADRRNIDGQ